MCTMYRTGTQKKEKSKTLKVHGGGDAWLCEYPAVQGADRKEKKVASKIDGMETPGADAPAPSSLQITRIGGGALLL